MDVEAFWEIRPFEDCPDEGRIFLWNEVNGKRVGPEIVVASGKLVDLQAFEDGTIGWHELAASIRLGMRGL